MKNERKFFICSVCGNIVELVEAGGGTLVCCGQEMKPLIPNTVEASHEKHIPVATRQGGKLLVQVGSVPHPMTEEHHIAWIEVVQGCKTQRVMLDITGKPCAEFCVDNGPLSVYAYCNLHGLWVAEF